MMARYDVFELDLGTMGLMSHVKHVDSLIFISLPTNTELIHYTPPFSFFYVSPTPQIIVPYLT